MNSKYNKTNKQRKNKEVKEEYKTAKNLGKKKQTNKDEEWRRKERR